MDWLWYDGTEDFSESSVRDDSQTIEVFAPEVLPDDMDNS